MLFIHGCGLLKFKVMKSVFVLSRYILVISVCVCLLLGIEFSLYPPYKSIYVHLHVLYNISTPIHLEQRAAHVDR